MLGAEWKALDADGRAKYEAMAARDKERYAAAMEQYKSGGAGGAGGADGGAEGACGAGEEDGWASGGEGEGAAAGGEDE